MAKEKLIIIGGGASGLIAAKKLAGKYETILLEAATQVGGRVWSRLSQSQSRIIEGGAEFIHGHQKQTLKLLRKAGIEYVPVKGKMYGRLQGKWVEQHEMIPGWDALMKKMKKLKEDVSLDDFLDTFFSDDRYVELRQHAIRYAEGFDLADTGRVSAQWLYREWSAEEEEVFRIPAGYGALIHFLKQECEKKGCRILTNHTVRQVDWEKNSVRVYTNGNDIFDAHKLIVTIPLSILVQAANKSSVNFTTPLDEYVKAANNIGIGAVIKVVLHFQQSFWPTDMGFVFSDQLFPTWWTQLPDTMPVLTGWVGGQSAQRLSSDSNDQLLEKAIASLSAVFNKTHHELKAALLEWHIFNWQNEELNLRGYTYDTLKTKAARKLLNTPVADTIFFAGEGLYDGKSPGTVEAALISGREVASKLS